MSALVELRMRGCLHYWVVVSQYQCPMAAEIVDIFVPVDIPLVTALSPIDIKGIGVEFAGVMHQPAREDFARLAGTFFRFRCVFPVVGDNF